MGNKSEVRKRYQRQGSYQRRQSFDRRQRSTSRGSRYSDYPNRQLRYDRSRSGDSRDEKNCDQSQTLVKPSSDFPRCIRCQCKDCNQIKRNCDKIKKLIIEKLEVKKINKVNGGSCYHDEGNEMSAAI